MKKEKTKVLIPSNSGELERSKDIYYNLMLDGVITLLNEARKRSARTVNNIMTVTYWLVGKHIMEYEQKGEIRAKYGVSLLKKLSKDLTIRFGKGFSRRNIQQMRQFYSIWQKPSAKLQKKEQSDPIVQKPSEQLILSELSGLFKLPWSHYVRLLSVKNHNAREFYETEALRGGWSEPQLDRQISSLFYERTFKEIKTNI